MLRRVDIDMSAARNQTIEKVVIRGKEFKITSGSVQMPKPLFLFPQGGQKRICLISNGLFKSDSLRGGAVQCSSAFGGECSLELES